MAVMVVWLLLLLLVAGNASAQVLQPNPPTFDQAVQLAHAGRDADALATFQRLASRNPNDHQARLWIAQLHERMGNFQQAEAVYRSVLLEDSSNVAAMFGVGSVLIAQGEPDDAIELLDRAEQLDARNDAVLAALGRAHQDAGRSGIAIRYLELAVALAPTEQHRLSLEGARLSFEHRLHLRGFNEQFSGSTPDSHHGDLEINVRLSDTVRVIGRGQVQRKFGIREQRGGGGVEWRWRPLTTLRGQAIVGPDNRVISEGDYLGEIEHVYRRSRWSGTFRYFDFTGATVWVVSPGVAWSASDRVSLALRYALSRTDTSTSLSGETGHSLQAGAACQLRRRVWVTGGYAAGVEDFEHFSIDRIGNFRANTGSGGFRYDLPTLTSVAAVYEHQWRKGDVNMGRFTLSLTQRF